MVFRSSIAHSLGGRTPSLLLLVCLGACTDPATSDEGTNTSGSTTAADAADTTGAPGGCALATDPGCPTAPGTLSTEAVELLLSDEALRIVDVREPADFDAFHLPGAISVDGAALRATVDGVSGQVAPPEEVQAVFEQAGLAPTDPVLVYAAANETTPARVVWTLAYSGHTGPVWMLDGGFAQWSGEGRPVTSDPTAIEPSSYSPSIVSDLRVDAAYVLDHLDDPNVFLIDARSASEYEAGHIPGAQLVDWNSNLGDDGLLLSTEQLAELYAQPDLGATMVVYCQTGSRAAIDWLVLTLLRYEDVRIYDGSWSEWSANSDYPQET